MLLDLAHRYNLDLTHSFMVGDMERDAQAGLAAGTRAVLIPPLKPASEMTSKAASKSASKLDNTGRLKEFNSLLEFANWVKEGVI
jgi:histidinol phosphatase-like enzyme